MTKQDQRRQETLKEYVDDATDALTGLAGLLECQTHYINRSLRALSRLAMHGRNDYALATLDKLALDLRELSNIATTWTARQLKK